MNRFGYLRDPLFLVAVAGYALNQRVLKPLCSSPFLHGNFNDLLLLPAALPVLLWIQRRLSLRKDDRPPTWTEMGLHLVAWSVICEYLGPGFLHIGTGDSWDVAAYALGGIIACLWWNRAAGRIADLAA